MNGTEHAGAVSGEILTEEEMTSGASGSVSRELRTTSGKKRTVTGARTLRRSEKRRTGVLTREQAVRKVQEAAVPAGSYRSGSRYEDKRSAPEQVRTGSRYADVQNTQNRAETESPFRKFVQALKNKDAKAIAAVSAAALAAVVYAAGAVYFSSHFYPGTVIYGTDCGQMKPEEVKTEVIEHIGDYSLDIVERGNGMNTMLASQIDLSYVDDGGIENAVKAQKGYLWPFMLLTGKKSGAEIHTSYDKAEVDAVLREYPCFDRENVIEPEDAYLGETDTGYEIVPEVEGTLLDYEKTKNAVFAALDNGAAVVSLDEAECYETPDIYSDDEALNTEAEKLNALMGAKITYDFWDRQEVVDTGVIRTFINEYENGEWFIDPEKVRAYVAGLAEKYDTYGGYRSFHTSIGTVVDLYGGDYGWMIDQGETAQNLLEAVRNKAVETIDPIYTYTAMDRSTNDIGDTYVEVCISRQEMWCYQDGYLVVDTPVVTGNVNKGKATPSGGVWAIDAKMTDYTLVGADYRCPVKYWMPFNEDVGLHDLSSRYYFGGDIYLYAGSHGCVNTPLDAVQQIYNVVSVGTPVIVYE